MELTQFSQPQIFLFAVLAGILAGILYDVFRLLRTAGLNSLIHTVIQDIAFMCCFAVVSFLFAIAFNQGEVRFFTLLGHIAGLLAYRYTIGIVTGRLFESVAVLLRKLKSFTGRVIRKAYGLFQKIGGRFAKKAVFFRKNNKKNRKNDLQPDSAMVYNKKQNRVLPLKKKTRIF
ncbi:MAG: spore cortex biosynthesis protein YabQ [Christensenellales bacterium]